MGRIAAVLAMMCLCVCASAQSAEGDVRAEIQALRTEMRQELDALRKEMQQKDAEIARLRAEIESRNGTVTAAAPIAPKRGTEITSTTEVATHVQPPTPSAKEERKPATTPLAPVKGPDSIRYRGVEIRPTGFFAFESVFRSKSMSADINTPFLNLPYNGSGMAHVHEWSPSARQSRFGLLANGQFGGVKLSGYLETDFLGTGITSNNFKSNSYVLRIRQAFGQAAWKNGVTLTAGQTWTLLTENAVGTDARTEVPPQNIDPAQHLGFTWARQPGVRIQKRIGEHGTIAASLEQSQTIYSGSNAPTNFFFAVTGLAPGTNNPTLQYSVSPIPDVMSKFAYDRGRSHSEIGGVMRFFQNRRYPATGSPVNDTHIGGGFFVSTHFPLARKLDFGAKTTMGYGINRYAASEMPDVTVTPNGSLTPIRGAQGLLRAEFHATRKLDLLAYAGVEYAQRTFADNGSGTLVGYAPPTMDNTGCNVEQAPTSGGVLPTSIPHCVGATRVLQAGSIGYQYRFYEGPHGRFQTSVMYTRLTRDGWAGIGGAPHTANNMVFTSFRYVLP